MKTLRAIVAVLLLAVTSHAWGWGRTGHRLVAEIAWDNLTPEAKHQVELLLGKESLGDIASWADTYLAGNRQTAFWHYVNIPPGVTYNRDRDCQVQPGVTMGSHSDKWRDCIIDRIPYNAERLADTSLDTADRAVALKFLVHLVGDEHQPLHAYGLGRGANDIPVTLFGDAAPLSYSIYTRSRPATPSAPQFPFGGDVSPYPDAEGSALSPGRHGSRWKPQTQQGRPEGRPCASQISRSAASVIQLPRNRATTIQTTAPVYNARKRQVFGEPGVGAERTANLLPKIRIAQAHPTPRSTPTVIAVA